ncbi:MAG: hypothetical protein WDA07_11680 [Leucobacter sp.]
MVRAISRGNSWESQVTVEEEGGEGSLPLRDPCTASRADPARPGSLAH